MPVWAIHRARLSLLKYETHVQYVIEMLMLAASLNRIHTLEGLL